MRAVLKGVLAVAVVAAVVQGVLWYLASRAFADLAQAVAPVATLDYDGSFAWPNGRAGIRRVRLTPNLAPNQEASAESIALETGNPWTLFRLLSGGLDEPPDELVLRVERLRLSALTERQLREQASRWGYLAPFEALGCTENGRFGSVDYADLDWLQAHADVDLGYRLDRARGELSLRVGYDMAPLARFSAEFDWDRLPQGFSPSALASQVAQLRRLLLRYDDRGMIASRNAYCARRRSEDAEAFLATHVAAVTEELEAAGVFADAPVMDLYRRFAAAGGTLEVSAAPSDTVAMADYRHYSPADRLRLLNLGISHDGGARIPVTARFFTTGAEAGSGAGRASESVAVRAPATEADALLFEELPELAGRTLRVSTHQGVDYVGTLLGIDGPMIRLRTERLGGRAQTVVLTRDHVVSMRLVD